MDRHTPTEADEGKHVVTATGDPVGVVTSVTDQGAFVDPHADVRETTMERLDWTDDDEYTIDHAQIDTIDEDEIRLRPDI